MAKKVRKWCRGDREKSVNGRDYYDSLKMYNIYIVVGIDSICMKAIQISVSVRDRLKDSDKNGTLDDRLNLLMDKSEKPSVIYKSKKQGRTNLRIKDETLERLKEYKLYKTESHSDTILRLLDGLSD